MKERWFQRNQNCHWFSDGPWKQRSHRTWSHCLHCHCFSLFTRRCEIVFTKYETPSYFGSMFQLLPERRMRNQPNWVIWGEWKRKNSVPKTQLRICCEGDYSVECQRLNMLAIQRLLPRYGIFLCAYAGWLRDQLNIILLQGVHEQTFGS